MTRKQGSINVSLIVKRIKKLSWLDVAGVAIFFFILTSSAFFLLRQGSEVIVTMRLLERNAPDFTFNLPRHYYIENLHSGMMETDELGRNALEILEVQRYPTGEIYQDVYVTLKVKTVFNKRTGQHSFNGKPLLIGEYNTFRLKEAVINGIIIELSDEHSPREKKKYSIQAYLDSLDHEVMATSQEIIIKDFTVSGVKNYLAEKVTPGLKMADSNSEIIAEILEVRKLRGRRPIVQNNQYVTVTDPERTQVFLTLEITAEKINDSYYFQKLTPLIVGKKISFVSGDLSIKATITSVKTID